MDTAQLEKNINYVFKNKKYLRTALTHSSYANERKNKLECNERLEFLGDSVLGFIVSDYIFKNCSKMPEGDLTKVRASLVCEKSLSTFARQINLGEFIVLSNGERNNGGAFRPSILCDAFEAVIAAIYMDAGIEAARKFVLRFIIPCLDNPSSLKSAGDYKTQLQEIVQKNPGEQLSYELVSEKGPDHDKHFQVVVKINNNIIGKGGGKSKKEAEQQAAREALGLMGY